MPESLLCHYCGKSGTALEAMPLTKPLDVINVREAMVPDPGQGWRTARWRCWDADACAKRQFERGRSTITVNVSPTDARIEKLETELAEIKGYLDEIRPWIASWQETHR